MANGDRALGRHAAWLIMGAATACVLALGATILLIPPRLESHQDQIAYALRQHGLAYQQITLTKTERDTQHYFAYAGYFMYGADVTIQLPNTRQVAGHIECRMKDSECKLYLAALGLEQESLPELDNSDQWFWLDWLKRVLPKLEPAGEAHL